ncbi:MAG: methyltransferase domain-containing protein [Pirellulaceae bacterium]
MRPYANPDATTRILDMGSGGGDVLCRIVQLARNDGYSIHATGWDISETACVFAKDHAASMFAAHSETSIEFLNEDAINGTQSGTFDVVFCSLFLHHLTSQDAITLLQRMKRMAVRAVLVDDLSRNRWGYALAWLGTRIPVTFSYRSR